MERIITNQFLKTNLNLLVGVSQYEIVFPNLNFIESREGLRNKFEFLTLQSSFEEPSYLLKSYEDFSSLFKPESQTADVFKTLIRDFDIDSYNDYPTILSPVDRLRDKGGLTLVMDLDFEVVTPCFVDVVLYYSTFYYKFPKLKYKFTPNDTE